MAFPPGMGKDGSVGDVWRRTFPAVGYRASLLDVWQRDAQGSGVCESVALLSGAGMPGWITVPEESEDLAQREEEKLIKKG